MKKKKLYVLLGLLVVASMVLAACGDSSEKTPEPCSWCHTEAVPATVDPSACTLEAEGFDSVDTEIMGEASDLQWDTENGTLSSKDGTVNISIPDGQTVTPSTWPDNYSYLQGWSFGNCQGTLYMKQPAQVHTNP